MSVILVRRYAGGYEDRGILFGRPKVGMVNSKKKNVDSALVDFARYGNYTTFHLPDLTPIARIRTEHCSLDQYLGRFNITDNSECDCGQGIETVRHFLLAYPNHEREKDKLRRSTWDEKLLGDAKRIKDTMQFIGHAERFEF